MVLTEVGQFELVLDYGPRLLQDWATVREHKRDVLLSMALSACGVASDLFAQSNQVRCMLRKR